MSPRKLSEKELLSRLGTGNADFIFEVIVSTCDANGVPNAAPMGIRFIRVEDSTHEKKIMIKPFKSTTTYCNLSSQCEAVINVTSDPILFYEAAFKHQSAQGNLKTSFCPAKTVKPPWIKGCDAYIEVSVESIRDAAGQEKDRSEILCQVKSIQLQNQEAKLYSRAPYVLIESIIHATRVNELRSQGLADEANELTKLINRYRKLIQRVAPSSKYEDTAEELVRITNAGEEETRSDIEEEG
jgi:hypothetical protein